MLAAPADFLELRRLLAAHAEAAEAEWPGWPSSSPRPPGRRAARAIHGDPRREEPHRMVPLGEYADPAGPYAGVVVGRALAPDLDGHLLALTFRLTEGGLVLRGEVSDAPSDVEPATRWTDLAELRISDPALLRLLVFRLEWLTHHDPGLARRRRLTREPTNLYRAAVEVITVPRYDDDPVRNLQVIEALDARMKGERSIAEVLESSSEARDAVDRLAAGAYGVADALDEIRDALSTVL